MQQRIIGPVVALNIPFREDETIDYSAMERYVDFLAKNGSPTLLLTYGSSEYAALCDEEVYELTKVIASANGGRSVFVAATKCWTAQKSIEYIEYAGKCGAQSVKVQPPYYACKVDQSKLAEYYKQISDAVDMPLWAYSMPVAGNHPGITPQTWHRIVEECSNVYAMKNDGDMIYGQYNLIRNAGEKAMVVSGGQMKTVLFGWQLGAKSYLCPVAPVFPKEALLFTDYMQKGMNEEAIQVIHRFEDPMIDICEDIDWLVMIKGMLYCAGHFPTPLLRRPAKSADKEQIARIRRLYEEIKALTS
jgi:dihydrodipicolinate synthase/N-acetylneuraminate lyase